ncbi:MAG: hypothetical protein FD122_3754, partial [Stygiobacter sp.]
DDELVGVGDETKQELEIIKVFKGIT